MRSALSRLALPLLACLLSGAALVSCGGPTQAQIDEYIRQQEEAAAQEEEADVDPGPSPQEVALQILQTCALDDVGRLLALLETLAPLVDASRPLPPFELVGIDANTLAVSWRLDTDGDEVADMLGSFRFQDPAGSPTLPLTQEELELILAAGGGLDWLPDVLDRLPDQSTLLVSFTQQGAAEVSGLLGITLGAVQDVLTGTINVFAVQCTTAFRLRSVTAVDLVGAYPNADVPITVAAPQGLLVGSVLMDGTSEAVIRVTYEETPLAFVFDLDDGSLAPADPTPGG